MTPEEAEAKLRRLMKEQPDEFTPVVHGALRRYGVTNLTWLREQQPDMVVALAESWDDDFDAESDAIIDSLDPDEPNSAARAELLERRKETP